MQICTSQVACYKAAMQKDRMKWDDLRVFLAVARQTRLLNAGRTLGLDPATVGRRIGALEEALGTKLFDRSPQGYALTEAGRGLVAHAQAMEAQASAAAEEVGGQADRLSGTVRIGAPDGV
jgi:DNA-binding transcriptional LysR family regulator